jgi:hypothetical protein
LEVRVTIQKLIAMAALTLSTCAAQERAGNQIFRIPQGWVRSEMNGSTILSPTAEPANYLVILLNGHNLKGDFREAFDRDVKLLNGTQRVLNASEVQSRHTPEGIDLLATTVELQDAKRIKSGRYYMAASVAGRYELMAYMAMSPALFKQYWPVVQQFAGTWSFANVSPSGDSSPATAAAPAGAAATVSSNTPASTPPPGRLDGVYSGYKYIYVNNLGAVQKQAKADYFSFFPDGNVYWGFPMSGLANFNLARACAGGRVDFCGTYQVNGDHITILLNRNTFRQDGVFESGGMRIGDRPYKLLPDISKSAAHTLEGVFGRADARPGEDLARKGIQFTRDGRFVDQGLVTTVVSSEIINGNPHYERPGGSGTYTLAPYTLILRYSDGYVRQVGISIDAEDMDAPAINKFVVNTYHLVRRR